MYVETPARLLNVENELGVLEWRYLQLHEAGYPTQVATELAARADIDLHLAIHLLEHGCPLDLALSILW